KHTGNKRAERTASLCNGLQLKTATLGGRIGSNKVLFVFLQIEKRQQ
ncbi:MAG: roadblock/LC7 domain-containing protein, partial [Bacteroidia bacterium]